MAPTDVDQSQHRGHAFTDLSRRHAVETTLEVKELAPCLPIVERRLLQGHADAQPDGLGMACHIVPCDEGDPTLWSQQCAEHPDGGGLSGSIRPQEPVDLAPLNREVDAADRVRLAKAPDQATSQYGGGGHF